MVVTRTLLLEECRDSGVELLNLLNRAEGGGDKSGSETGRRANMNLNGYRFDITRGVDMKHFDNAEQ